MRNRIAISVAVATLALAIAAQAIALAPAPDSPGDGATFTSGEPIVFRGALDLASTSPRVDFYISRNQLQEADGVFSNWFDAIQGKPLGGTPPSFEGVPDQDEGWPKKPGTYFWQAVEVSCTVPPPCASTPRSLVVNPLPASAVNKPSEIETFLDRKPDRRIRKRRAKFRFSSNVEGARFSCLFANGWQECDSPVVFRRLDPGRYRFKVRAVLSDDLKDPTPVKWIYRVLPPKNN